MLARLRELNWQTSGEKNTHLFERKILLSIFSIGRKIIKYGICSVKSFTGSTLPPPNIHAIMDRQNKNRRNGLTQCIHARVNFSQSEASSEWGEIKFSLLLLGGGGGS